MLLTNKFNLKKPFNFKKWFDERANHLKSLLRGRGNRPMKNTEGPDGAGCQIPVEMPGGHSCVTPFRNTKLPSYKFGFGR